MPLGVVVVPPVADAAGLGGVDGAAEVAVARGPWRAAAPCGAAQDATARAATRARAVVASGVVLMTLVYAPGYKWWP